MLNNVRSVSWYGYHNTYRFAILGQNTLLRQKHLHVSCNDHSLLIFSRHWTCDFAFFPLSLNKFHPKCRFRDCRGILMKRNEEICSRPKYVIFAFALLQHSNLVCNKRLLTYLLSPWSRNIFEMLIVSKLVKKFPLFFRELEVSFP